MDVLVLLPDGIDAMQPGPVSDAVERFITTCWDVGLEIGSSVRTVPECVTEAPATSPSRPPARSPQPDGRCAPLFRRLVSAWPRPWTRGLQAPRPLEAASATPRFDDTPYALEPNCKESPGGLRDLQC